MNKVTFNYNREKPIKTYTKRELDTIVKSAREETDENILGFRNRFAEYIRNVDKDMRKHSVIKLRSLLIDYDMNIGLNVLKEAKR